MQPRRQPLQLCRLVVPLLLLLLVNGGSNSGSGFVVGAEAFRFTLEPGKVKCFTNEQPEGGRYELRYRMMRSLTPFVSVAITSRGGRVLLEHEMALPDAKEILQLGKSSLISICFHTAAKAAAAAVSMNVTLDIVDAEDAELTRLKKQRYSTSSPITLGIGKASGAMQQMEYIYSMILEIRKAFVHLTRADEDMRYSLKEAQWLSWIFEYVFVGIGVIIVVGFFLRLRSFMKKMKLL